MTCFCICCMIIAITFSTLIYSLVQFRKTKKSNTVHFHQHLGAEIFWTTIPTLILIALAIPAAMKVVAPGI